YTVTLSTTPTATITATTTQTCIDGNPITIYSSPAGGVYSGTPILGNNFLPNIAGVGVHPIIYSVTNSEGCIGRDTVWITVHDLPTAQINNLPLQYCIDSAAFALSGIIGGGTFSGPGVSSGIFDPSVAGIGTHAIVYQVTDINGCINSDTAYIEVISSCNTANLLHESLNSLSVHPNPTVGEVWIEFECTQESPIRISLQTLEGKTIHTLSWQTLIGKNKISMNIGNLSSGLYFLKVENQHVQLYRNLVVSK
ncbi:MAG: T9SS type A sorting domain-containing protein, partial [Flavobacteriales bacterium]|nr:T9SS type A sorting domain-containing protein [Flavobacteriales bacterium]